MQNSFFPVLILALLGTINSYSQDIVINEFQASNSTTVTDPDFGIDSDWIEFYNAGAEAVDLNGWSLTDNLEDTLKWRFPGGVSISPGEFLLVWADGKDLQQTNLHTNFKLSITGEKIVLFDPLKVLVDSLSYGQQWQDISYGRQPDGGIDWHLFDSPTPGTSNITSPYLKASSPSFSLLPGFYTTEQVLEIDARCFSHYQVYPERG